MALVPLSFPSQSSPGETGHEGKARLINAYAEELGQDAKAPTKIRAAAGLKAFATLAGGTGARGMIVLDNALYAVDGPILYKVDASGTASVIGGVPGSSPVFMAINRKAPTKQVAIVSEGQRFLLENDVLSPIADDDLPPPVSVHFLDGFFVFPIPDGRFFISAIDEGSDINSLDFATAEGSPDGLVAGATRARELWLFGERTIEVWQNTGDASFAFERLPGVFIEFGCRAPNSVRKFLSTLVWVDHENIVRLADGYTPRRISSHAVERDLAAIADDTAIKGFTFTVTGHQFYCLTSPQWTWVFDGTTGLWHERQSYNQSNWRGLWSARFAGKTIIGDSEGGKLYELDGETYDEAGTPLVMDITAAPQHAYPSRLRINAFYADLIPGVGLNSSDIEQSDPKVMLLYSKDGGVTFDHERLLRLGKIGETRVRVNASRLGLTSEDGWSPRLKVSAAVCRGLTGAAADVDRLGS